ncbi:MAG: aliphatic nitrilase, partial [Deltaproteobacteria bacterium]|nr:aliphatic nitrilase [Deltaproteobacteria bacterium]
MAIGELLQALERDATAEAEAIVAAARAEVARLDLATAHDRAARLAADEARATALAQAAADGARLDADHRARTLA